MKNTFKLILALAAISGSANAATIVVQSGSPALDFKLSSGSRLLTSGSGVVLGYIRGFSTATAAAVGTALADQNRSVLTYLAANFVPIAAEGSNVNYGTSAAATPWGLKDVGGVTTASGTIENSNWLSSSGSAPANSEQAGGLVRGTRIFLLAYNGSSLSNATELGIFSASTWTLPASASLNTLSMTLTQVDQASEVYRGSIGSLVLAPVVPESSTSALALLAGLGLMSRRRR